MLVLPSNAESQENGHPEIIPDGHYFLGQFYLYYCIISVCSRLQKCEILTAPDLQEKKAPQSRRATVGQRVCGFFLGGRT